MGHNAVEHSAQCCVSSSSVAPHAAHSSVMFAPVFSSLSFMVFPSMRSDGRPPSSVRPVFRTHDGGTPGPEPALRAALRKARGWHGHPEDRGIHHGTMVARAGRTDPCEAPGLVARWHAPDLRSSHRPQDRRSSSFSRRSFPSRVGKGLQGPRGKMMSFRFSFVFGFCRRVCFGGGGASGLRRDAVVSSVSGRQFLFYGIRLCVGIPFIREGRDYGAVPDWTSCGTVGSDGGSCGSSR